MIDSRAKRCFRNLDSGGSIIASVILLVGLISFLAALILNKRMLSSQSRIAQLVNSGIQRGLDDIGLKIGTKLRDDPNTWRVTYGCGTAPSAISAASAGLSSSATIFFSCYQKSADSDFIITIEDRQARAFAPSVTEIYQVSRCTRVDFKFTVAGAMASELYVSFAYDPAISRPSDHVWSGGTTTGIPASSGCDQPGLSCYRWDGSGSISLKSSCASSITSLNLSNANISSFESPFSSMSGLQTLSLHINPFTSLPTGIFDGLTHLSALNMHVTSLTALPPHVFKDLSSLTTVSLNNSQLTSLDPDTFSHSPLLTTISLDANQLTTLPAGIFSANSALQNLSLHINPFTSLPTGIFDGLTHLSALSMHVTSLTALPPHVFKDLSSLTIVSLNNSQLASLDSDIFSHSPLLTGINLEANQLTTLPAGLFNANSNLQNLSLQNNQIVNLPANLFAGPPLNALNIFNNKLTSADVDSAIQTLATATNPSGTYAFRPQSPPAPPTLASATARATIAAHGGIVDTDP